MFSSAGNNTTNSEMQQGPAAPIINIWQEAREARRQMQIRKGEKLVRLSHCCWNRSNLFTEVRPQELNNMQACGV